MGDGCVEGGTALCKTERFTRDELMILLQSHYSGPTANKEDETGRGGRKDEELQQLPSVQSEGEASGAVPVALSHFIQALVRAKDDTTD